MAQVPPEAPPKADIPPEAHTEAAPEAAPEPASEPAVASVPEVSTKTSSTPKKSRSTKRKASAKEISISAEKENVETDALQSIVAMGFKKAMALDALQENNYVLQDAVDWLMRNVS